MSNHFLSFIIRFVSRLGGFFMAILILALHFGCSSDVQRPPNVILIMADDLGYENLNCYGGQSYETPNLDRLAEEGMRFDHCYSMPLCTPSRVQIMTGKYNFRNYLGFGILDSTQQTFGDLFQDAGYRTCVVGKWQLYGNRRQQELVDGLHGSRPEEAGFDQFCLWQVQDRGWRYKDPTVETSEGGLETHPGNYGPDVFLDYIERFIDQYRDKPFFVYFPMCLVHDPFLPTPDRDDFEAYLSSSKTNDTTYFRDMVRYMDHVVNRISVKLKERNLANNTLLLFTGDNGTDRDVISTFRGQRIRGQKGYPVEYGTHVPLIAWWPGVIQPGTVNQNLVDFTDFLPTITEAVGYDLPDDFKTDGISFYAQLLGEEAKVRDWVFCHYDPRWGRFEKSRYVHNKEWKLYENGEMYNISVDPLEQNVFTEDNLPESAQALREEFSQVLNQMK
jgi:arylsulfatase A-like enzyme